MATINLGSIKFNWRGAYNNSTAYAVDDVVSSGGSSYICILASTGNAVTNTTYWNVMSQGGTDVGTTLTTQGDILYRDGSGLQRLAKGTAGNVLKQGSNHPEWGTVSSDFVKISHLASTSGSSATINLENVFDDSVYGGYQMIVNYRMGTNTSMYARFLNGSTAYSGGTDYRRSGMHMYRRNDNSENSISANSDGNGTDYMQMQGWGHNTSYNNIAYFRIGGDLNTANGDFPRKYCFIDTLGTDNSGGSAGNYYWGDLYWHHFTNHGVVNGIQIIGGSNITDYAITLWGMKK